VIAFLVIMFIGLCSFFRVIVFIIQSPVGWLPLAEVIF